MTTPQACTTPSCDKPAPNGYLCKKCGRRLERDLATIADLSIESGVTLMRTDKVGTGCGKSKGGPSPLPLNEHAVLVRDEVRNTVSTWVRHLAGDRIPAEVRTVEQACTWMLTYSSAWLLLPEAGDLAQAMAMCAARLRRLVDQPESPTYLGAHTCGSDVWARAGQDYKTCDCGSMLDLAEIRDGVTLRVRQVWATAREICEAAHMFQVPINKMMISRWYRDGAIPPAAVRHRDGGRSLEFRVGIVVDLAKRHAEAKQVS